MVSIFIAVKLLLSPSDLLVETENYCPDHGKSKEMPVSKLTVTVYMLCTLHYYWGLNCKV